MVAQADKKPLGTISVPPGTFEHDRILGEAYCAYSAELLRLSLLGIAGVGFLVTKMPGHSKSAESPLVVAACLLMLAIGAGAALMHRFLAPDSLACQLRALRLDLRNAAGDREESADEKVGRRWRFKWSKVSLRISAAALWLGAGLLGIAFLLSL